ncbi:MAG: hypothetical protein WCD38_06670 [Candidatus Tumulicola sp.]
MEYEAACDRLCDDIAHLLLDVPRVPIVRAAFAAGRATQDLADAFHHAAGLPDDSRWSEAVESLEHFLDIFSESKVEGATELRELRRFVAENADALSPRSKLKLAS